MSVNKVILLGRLGADPELRYTPSQLPVCNLNVATNDRRKNGDGEWADFTEWHRVVVWGKQGENCNQYLSKGREVYIEGRIQTSKWQDKEGKDRYTTEVVANSIKFVGGKGDSSQSSRGSSDFQSAPSSSTFQSQAAVNDPITLDDDDIPF